MDISKNLLRQNIISFDYEKEFNAKIDDNQIKIDNINIKSHQVDYSEKIKKYNLFNDIDNLNVLYSEVKFSNLRKHIFIYSPLIIKNKTPYTFNLIFYRKTKSSNDQIYTLKITIPLKKINL